MLEQVNQNYGNQAAAMAYSEFGAANPTALNWGGQVGGYSTMPAQQLGDLGFGGQLYRAPLSLADKIVSAVVDGVAKIVSKIIDAVIQSFVPQITNMIQNLFRGGLFGQPPMYHIAGGATQANAQAPTTQSPGNQTSENQPTDSWLSTITDTFGDISDAYNFVKDGYNTVKDLFGSIGGGVVGKAVNFIKNIF